MITEELSRFLLSREGFKSVQDLDELSEICKLAENCASYLEVGTAEGNSLCSIANNLSGSSKKIVSVDRAEDHTRMAYRDAIVRIDAHVEQIKGYSAKRETVRRARDFGPYDMVLIDAGHRYEDVIGDAIAYGEMANKYIVFHDLCLDEVRKAVDWYVSSQRLKDRFSTIGNKFIYGVITL